MSKIKDTFFGGAEKKAGKRIERAGRESAARIGAATEAAEGDITPFIQQGGGLAFNRQEALSGAAGPEAQAQAFQEFQESPGVDFAREQGLRLIDSKAGAGGGGGGERLRELTRFSQGLALQDFSNQFNRLGSVAGQEEAITGRQQTAATNLGGLRLSGATGQGANLISGAQGRAQGDVGQAAGLRGGIGQAVGAGLGFLDGGVKGAFQGAFGG